MRGKLVMALFATAALSVPAASQAQTDDTRVMSIVRSIDGSGNNLAHPTWGQAGALYLRVAPANYADGFKTPVSGPPTRYVSNRIFNDVAQNIFSERNVTQWGFVWGQFMDHTFGLRQETGGETANIAWQDELHDPLEEFSNDLARIDFSRTPAAPGTGVRGVPRQQINTVSSYIDGSSVYSDEDARLDWLREGPVDGHSANNGPHLLLDPGGLLPRRSSRGNTATAPVMALQGRLMFAPDKAMVAGDQRANENVALTATHTLFAREHNRIVDALPSVVPDELKFQIARRVVGAEQQYITYNEFLPALGVRLSDYRGYDASVNATLGNEFAVVGYRAHSMIHGEMEPSAPSGTYTEDQLEAFEAMGIEVEDEAGVTTLVIPLNLAFGNPDLLAKVGLGPVLKGIGGEPEYKNDEMIDNQLRSVLFQIPRPGAPNPLACLDGVDLPDCFKGVQDLGAIDVERGRDHGMPLYNDLRRAFGLAPKTSFTAITGENTDAFPNDPLINKRKPLDDPNILDFVQLRDINGNVLPLNSEEGAVAGVRRTTTAARLKAVYGDVNKLDAFTGMVAERHVSGSEFGELQRTIWKKQFEALRDGDRFFYANDPALPVIERLFGITYRKSLARIIKQNTGVDTQANVFEVAE